MAKLKPNQFLLNGQIITEIPLLFQIEMVQANLEDRKTQTRRTKGLGEINETPDAWDRDGNPLRECCRFWDSSKEPNPNPLAIEFGFKRKEDGVVYVKSPYGKPGDLLWVRETMHRNNNSNTYWPVADGYIRTAPYEQTIPSIHMPKAAARLWLMVEEIRVERVQDISEADAVAEGIIEENSIGHPDRFKDYLKKDKFWYSPKSSFRSLWISINGQASWKQNPWVWAVRYRILSKTGRPSNEVIEQNWKEVCGG